LAWSFRRQAQGEAPSRQRTARGLEDEEAEDAASSPEDENSPGEVALKSKRGLIPKSALRPIFGLGM